MRPYNDPRHWVQRNIVWRWQSFISPWRYYTMGMVGATGVLVLVVALIWFAYTRWHFLPFRLGNVGVTPIPTLSLEPTPDQRMLDATETAAATRATATAARAATATSAAAIFSAATGTAGVADTATTVARAAESTDVALSSARAAADATSAAAAATQAAATAEARSIAAAATADAAAGSAAQTATARPTLAPKPTATPAPPRPAVDILQGSVHWTPAQGPIIVRRNIAVPTGSILIIEPGTEVRFSPGVSLFVDGRLLSLGKPDAPVKLLADQGGLTQQWEGIFGNAGNSITLESTEIHGAGSGGTMLISKEGELIVRNSRLTDNGGQIFVQESNLEVSGSEIARNQLPYGAALSVSSERGNAVVLKNNRIIDNDHSQGVPDVLIAHPSVYTTLPLDIQGNLIARADNGDGDNLVLSTSGPLVGTVGCNTLMGGSLGFNIRSETRQIPGFNLAVYANVLDSHTPPIIPVYLKYGIGRGAASEVVLDMHGNWWGEPTGPYEPDLNPLGRGDAVGENINYREWLTSWPECAPHR